MAFLFSPRYQAVDANGLPVAGATLTFYRAGTSSKITIYQNSQATVPHTNPVVADSAGNFAAIFLTTVENYKFILKDSSGVTIQTVDRVPVGGTIDTETLEQAVNAVVSAVPNAFPVNRTALKALDTTVNTAAYLKESGRESQFIWRSGDYSSQIAADTQEYTYIKADAIAATAGAWMVSSQPLVRGTLLRPVAQILRDTPPSISDFGGVGDGTANDRDAIRNCLDAYGVCYLPYHKPGTYTPATWLFSTEIVLGNDQQIIGDPRKPKVKQGAGDNLFVINGRHTRIENVLIDPSNQSANDSSQTTILFNTASTGIQDCRIKGLVWGIDRDVSTLLPGRSFMSDLPHGSNTIVDLSVEDVTIWGALGNPVLFQRIFADTFFKDVLIDWTRQSHVPVVSGFTIQGGEGIFFEGCTVQGVGTTGVGNSASDGFNFTNGAAIGIDKCRGDVCGGNAFSFVGTNGVEMVMPIASLCGQDQFYFESVANLKCLSPYAGGRAGQAWAPAGRSGLWIKGCTGWVITDLKSVGNTGAGAYVENCTGGLMVGMQGLSNGTYGIQEAGTSNFNGVCSSRFSGNGTNNGIFAGAASFYNGIMRNSGVSAGYAVPGAGVAW